jgi:hypothetical protein
MDFGGGARGDFSTSYNDDLNKFRAPGRQMMPGRPSNQRESIPSPRPWRGNACGDWSQLQGVELDDRKAASMTVNNE